MDRIGDLIAKVEAGERLTQDDVDRAAQLLELDAIQRVAQFAEEMEADERAADESLAESLAKILD